MSSLLTVLSLNCPHSDHLKAENRVEEEKQNQWHLPRLSMCQDLSAL